MKAFRTILPYVQKKIWFLAAGLLALIIVDVLQLLIPQVLKRVVDDLTRGSATLKSLIYCGLIIIGINLIIGVFRFGWRYLILGNAYEIERRLRSQLFNHLQILPLSFFNRVSTGEIMAHATNDLNAVRMSLGMALVALVDGVILSLMSIGFMAHISLRLTVYALLPAPVLIVLANVFAKLVHDRFLRIQEAFSRLTEKARENFAGIRVIKSYVQEDDRSSQLRNLSSHLVHRNMNLVVAFGLFYPIVFGIINLCVAIVLVLGGRQAILLDITPGDFVAYISYLAMLAWPLVALGWVMNLIQRGAASMERINVLLREAPEPSSPSPSAPLSRINGRIEFRNLSFAYDGGPAVLNSISLLIHPGETIGIVGRVGSGKSTLLNLLFRLYEPNPAQLFIDDHDILAIPQDLLRRDIAYVPQDTFLFSDTVNENIRFGAPEASPGQVTMVARASHLFDEVLEFPKGFETIVGEKGIVLSGGQKQRIAIARALLRDASVFVLDNALSSVDAYAEERIIANLKPLMKERTTIIVTHRISSIKDADRIFVFDQGCIREQGTHADLMNQNGLYVDMFKRQQIEKELNVNNTQDSVPYER
ncbi:MAG TPA: ABC transporter ATP-binding protein [Thermodesulfobacteriota bacterium]|nr:ABC transporter ATP-binding protein [Deltaproteobacteria bacterium]HNR11957.1 ABC transporter ATP-binding protein [Thermodesulfobacteriota bacterium]HNU72831.1 ABC transporter ATP-binding protein [Thermodesulfobacteriota bacterium]HOC38273.1 ABC transporter ATP-binding protein [Thermodesulfobacteriota bacterium]